MTVTEVTPKRGKAADDPGSFRSPTPVSREPERPRMRIIPFLLTLATVALAGLLGWGMWEVYMGTPWTRDATVRAYVVTMAPEVEGRIVELPVADNKYVRKGDLLMVIDSTDYRIAVSQAEASVQQAEANVQNVDAQMTVQQAQIRANQALLDQAKGRTGVRPAAGWPIRDPGEAGLWLRSECATVHLPAASTGGCSADRPR
jgi:multidrug resistance efflux pump